jgi:hypothetical protein
MHSINEHQAFRYSTLTQAGPYLFRDVEEASPRRHFKPEFLAITLHVKT